MEFLLQLGRGRMIEERTRRQHAQNVQTLAGSFRESLVVPTKIQRVFGEPPDRDLTHDVPARQDLPPFGQDLIRAQFLFGSRAQGGVNMLVANRRETMEGAEFLFFRERNKDNGPGMPPSFPEGPRR
jgi:hypothetical protein